MKLLRSRNIENTRWVSFDITFTRQGFENAYWHREACRAIQHAFSKPSMVNFISKDANLVFYLSVYPLVHSSNYQFWRNFRFLCWFSVISDVSQKVQRHHDHVGLLRTSSVRISFCQDTTCIFNSLAGGRVAIVTMHSLRRLIHWTVTMFL